jgi:lysophospholipase L1-like esterase
VYNFGEPGEISAAGLDRLRQRFDQAETLPDAVIVLYGTNDLGLSKHFGLSDDAAARRVASIVTDIKSFLQQHGVGAVIVGLPIDYPHGPGAPPEAKAAAKTPTFRLLRARLLEIRPVVDFRLRRAGWYTDLFHPNDDGALVLAERARRAVRRVLRSGRRGPARPQRDIAAHRGASG